MQNNYKMVQMSGTIENGGKVSLLLIYRNES